VGKWAERAKAAYERRRAERDYHSPSPSLHGQEGTRIASSTALKERQTVGTLSPAHPGGSDKNGTEPAKIGPTETPQGVAQKAQKAQKVADPTPIPPAPAVGHTYVDTADKLEYLIEHLMRTRMVGLDLETTGLRWWQDRIRIISITTEDGKTYLVDAVKVDIISIFPALKDTEIIAHNALFDLLFLKRAGFGPGERACTMILSQILWAGKLKPGTAKNVDHDLASVVKRTLDIELDKSHQRDDWSGELTPEMLDYAARDSMFLVKLYKELTRQIAEAG
jgi:DNA polymerase III epsilon subunit-like protein